MNTIEEQAEQLRAQVETLQATVAHWQAAGLPRRTLVILLAHYTKVSQRTIKQVLEGIDALVDEYFTPEE